MKTEIFEKQVHINAPIETVFKWHARPGALERLVPPWEHLTVMEKTGGILKGARVKMKLKVGPVPVSWLAEHTEYDENRMFKDHQVQGPFSRWVHTHHFEPDANNGCLLKDHIEYALPLSPVSHIFGRSFIRSKLEETFYYRHFTTQQDIAAHQRGGLPRQKFLVSGASGVVGSVLIPFLTTGGHHVTRLVRNKPGSLKDAVYWNPQAHELNPDDIAGTDVVIHLAGENIGQGAWTPEKKKRIVESRTKGTSLIAETIAGLNPRPRVLICASAIGYYGNRDECLLSETDCAGGDFISDVCDQWEKAAAPALEKGIRVVFLRIGVALTPRGGALERLALPFQLGLGGMLGSGNQYMSWIGIDDIIGAIHHTLITETLEGPVNVVSQILSPTGNLPKHWPKSLTDPHSCVCRNRPSNWPSARWERRCRFPAPAWNRKGLWKPAMYSGIPILKEPCGMY